METNTEQLEKDATVYCTDAMGHMVQGIYLGISRDDIHTIKITEGPYQGIVFKYRNEIFLTKPEA
jgi:hypothetical protein